MKKLMYVVAVCFLVSIAVHAQVTKVFNGKYENGTIQFSYYEKDGVKVPHGEMIFTGENHVEKGMMKDGYRDGKWEIYTIGNLRKNHVDPIRIHANFKDGLLEGEYIREELKFNPKTKKYKVTAVDKNTFRKGHLFGPNMIAGISDTLRCDFDEKGMETGEWRYKSSYSSDERIIVFDKSICETNYNGSIIPKHFKVDILGNKTEAEFTVSYVTLTTGFDYSIREPFKNLFNAYYRPDLPTLCKNKKGYINCHDQVSEGDLIE